MSLPKTVKSTIIKNFQIKPDDTGSTRVQIALLTEDIRLLTQHLKTHAKDFNSKMGLIKKVSLRRRQLRYLSNVNQAEYKALIEQLGLKK